MKMPSRLNPDASSSRKMLELYSLLLFSGRKYTLTTLAERLQCSKTTIDRLISEIELFDQVERGKEGRERWYQINRLRKNKKVMIMCEQIQQLSLCKDFAATVLPSELKEDIESTVAQAAEFISDDCIKQLAMQPLGRSLARGSIDYTPFQGIIKILIQSISKKILCEVNYRSLSSPSPKIFLVAPMRLLTYNNAMYVENWRIKREADCNNLQSMVLSVQRIESVNPTLEKHSFKDMPGKDNENFGLIKSASEKVTLVFDKSVSNYVTERTWSSDQTFKFLPTGGVEMSLTANSLEEVVAWILSFGDKTEVVEPAHLRTMVRNRLLKSLEKYGFSSS
ncbi:helix-turn-helix transcriptional regulator [Solidesulfovibrio magneticus]|nr:WYL domain-containing protein [Solidesulfovibrio magneticus]